MKINKYMIIYMIFLCLLLTSCKNENKQQVHDTDKKETVNAIENQKDSSKASINYQDWLYFGNPDDNYKIYKMKTDGTNLTKLTDARYDGINSLEEWVYFIDTTDKNIPSKLAKVKFDGTHKQLITEENITSFCKSKDYVFYVFKNNLYKINKNGDEKTKIISANEDINLVKYYNDNIYFSTNNGIYSIDTEGKDFNLILDGNYLVFHLKHERIYYYNDKIYSSSLKGMDEREELGLDINSIFVSGYSTYYNQDNYLYKKDNKNGKIEKMFIEQYLNNFYKINSDIYFYGHNRIWKVKEDLSEKEILIGTGREHHRKMYIKVDDRIFSKNYEYQDNVNDNIFYKLYEVVGDQTGKKISDIAINTFDSNNDIIYYTDAKDKKLYLFDISTNEKKLVIDKTIGSFITYKNVIYYTDINNNYMLYCMDINSNKSTKITDIPVSNIKSSGDNIYFLDNKKRLGVFKEFTKDIKYINMFTTIYDILEDKIYYKNEEDNGILYRINVDGSNNIKVSNSTVKDIYTYENNIYYVEKNGANLLYKISNNNKKSQFLDILNENYTDMEIINGKIYMSIATEGGSYYTVEEYIEGLKYKLSYDITKQVDDTWKYFVYKVDEYKGYLYKFNVNTNDITLVVNKWVSDFQIDNGYIYYSGHENNGDYSPFIDKININNGEMKNIIMINDPKICNISYEILNDYIYYSLDDIDGSIWKQNLTDGSKNVIIKDSYELKDIIDNWLYYINGEKKIVRIKLDGKSKQVLTNTQAEFIYATKNYLYYLKINDEHGVKGKLIKESFKDGKKDIIVDKELQLSDLMVINHKLYYNLQGINIYNFLTGEKAKIYNKEVDYFNLIGDILYLSIQNGEHYETVKIHLQ